MSSTVPRRGSTATYLAVLAAAAMALSLLPLTGTAFAQEGDDLADACPMEAGQSDFTDRDAIPEAHVRNVDCAWFLGIVEGFRDGTYRPRAAVRRDQMASFIARTLDEANVALPPASEADGFADATGNQHEDNILRLQAAGIVEGGPGSLGAESYGPAVRTRRDQMASFIVRAAAYAYHADVNALDESEQRFEDVPEGNTHFEKVNAAAEHGLAQGLDGRVFLPRRHTTRDQMASFMVRTLNFLSVPAQLAVTADKETATVATETVTVTARVTDQFGNAVPNETVTVSTDETQTVVVVPPVDTTDENGVATFQVRSLQPGDVTIVVSIERPGENFIVETEESTTVEFQTSGAGAAEVQEAIPDPGAVQRRLPEPSLPG